MLRVFTYMLIWLGAWLLYFPAVDEYPVANTAQMDNSFTATAQAGHHESFSVIGSFRPAVHFFSFFSGKPSSTGQMTWKPWFWGSGAAMLLFAFLLLIREKKVKQDKECLVLQKMHDLEQAALRSQMNPHFIFNALNSIQGFIIDGDKKSSSRYLSKFSKLVRSTMHYSNVPKITLEQELKMLHQYLELEQLRFNGKFNYELNVHSLIDRENVHLPPMMVQPFIENAIKHGIGPMKGKGKITVGFEPQKDALLVTITDNGIGLTASKKIKEKNRPHHISMGMKVTKKRLQLLSSDKYKQKLKVRELVDERGEVLGTEVRLKIMGNLN